MSRSSNKGMSSDSETKVPDETVIPNGDRILIISKCQLRIQVSSELLIQASPVFDVMLNLKFLECNKLHEGNEFSVEIKLPEDYGLATAQALKALHGSDPEMLLLAPDQIQKVSIIVDKYDMSPCFAMASAVWMDCEPINLEDAWKLMTAAYWLDHQVGFRRMSEYVIRKLNHAQIFRLANETLDATLGLKLGMALLLLHHALSQVMVLPKGGLCLPCFKIAVEDPVGMQPGCPCPSNHRSG